MPFEFLYVFFLPNQGTLFFFPANLLEYIFLEYSLSVFVMGIAKKYALPLSVSEYYYQSFFLYCLPIEYLLVLVAWLGLFFPSFLYGWS